MLKVRYRNYQAENRRPNRRGVALLITIAVTTVLVAAAIEYNRRARFQVIASAAARDRLTASEMAASGVHLAMAVLAQDKRESATDNLLEDWANPEKITGLLEEIPFEEGDLTLLVSDELGRIQVNALVDFPAGREFNPSQFALWERFIRLLQATNPDETADLGDSDPVAIINSIKDWIDRGDDDAITGLSGAESVYYEDLDPPYACANRPMNELHELLLVKGVTPELFYGDGKNPGMAAYLTVFGMAPGEGTSYRFPGKINLSTADVPVLTALLSSEDADLAQSMAEIRQELLEGNESYDFSDPAWYKNIPGFADVNIDSALITLSSDFFRIESSATVNNVETTVTAVVQRIQSAESGKWMCDVLSWEID
jgi:general secretion pathway protein K